VLHKGVARTVSVALQAPVRLIPFHIKGAPPSYFIVAGLVFTPATVPYLRSEYGKEYDFDAPVSHQGARQGDWGGVDVWGEGEGRKEGGDMSCYSSAASCVQQQSVVVVANQLLGQHIRVPAFAAKPIPSITCHSTCRSPCAGCTCTSTFYPIHCLC
jgi:hypothetical protein